MKNTLTVGAALLLTTSAAYAGGLDRSGQSIGAIFEEGTYVELSYGYVTPSVTGTFTVPAGPAAGLELGSGNVAPAYGAAGLAFKTDVTDDVSVALIIDQPFGAAVSYAEADAGYPVGANAGSAATTATVNSTAITLLGQYNFNENLSVHFGPRYLSANGDVTLAATLYSQEYESGNGSGYVAGVAYERQDIALRVALTYSSAIDLELDGVNPAEGDLLAKMPESINLDFQSGVAANTLVFGSIRWAGWSDAFITDTGRGGNLVSYEEDTMSYTLGVGRQFSDSLSGALSIGYEASQGGAASNLAPTDGNMSIGLGGTYKVGNGMELTGGVRYVMPGDATTEILGAEFADNSAIAIGLKVAYSF